MAEAQICGMAWTNRENEAIQGPSRGMNTELFRGWARRPVTDHWTIPEAWQEVKGHLWWLGS